MRKTHVGILIFDGVEVLDFAGPFEVFSRTRLQPGVESRRSEASAPFRVFTLAPSAGTVTATGGLRIQPDFTLDDLEDDDVPPVEILVVPGGLGIRNLLEDDSLLDWVRLASARAHYTTAVCTGSLLLARAGLLKGMQATTHWSALEELGALDPSIKVREDARVVVDGVTTSGGVAAGIDLAFHMVSKLWGPEVAEDTARYIDYPWPDVD